VCLSVCPIINFPSDHANRANADAQKNIKRCVEQLKELQTQVEEEQRSRDETRDQLKTSEKRCVALAQEKEELLHQLDAVSTQSTA